MNSILSPHFAWKNMEMWECLKSTCNKLDLNNLLNPFGYGKLMASTNRRVRGHPDHNTIREYQVGEPLPNSLTSIMCNSCKNCTLWTASCWQRFCSQLFIIAKESIQLYLQCIQRSRNTQGVMTGI